MKTVNGTSLNNADIADVAIFLKGLGRASLP